MSNLKEIKCNMCKKMFVPNVATASPDTEPDYSQIIHICDTCWPNSAFVKKEKWYQRLYGFLCFWFSTLTGRYILKKEYYTTETNAFNPSQPIQIVTETLYYNFPDKKFYATPAHAQHTNFFVAAIVCKMLRKKNQEENSKIWLEKVYKNKENNEYFLSA